MEKRWFLIRHKCGSTLTLSNEDFFNGLSREVQGEWKIGCPSCRLPVIESEDIKRFLDEYERLTKILKDLQKNTDKELKEYTIREIKDPDKLDL